MGSYCPGCQIPQETGRLTDDRMNMPVPKPAIDDRVRTVVAGQGRVIAAGRGPDGGIDGLLMFVRPGAIQLTPDGGCRFPLGSVAEGSPLRAWLRMSRYSGEPVPWGLLWTDRPAETSVFMAGTARLVPPDEGVATGRTESLQVEVFAVRTMLDTLEAGPSGGGSARDRARDAALRSLAEKPAGELTQQVVDFLAAPSESFLCTLDSDGQPRIRHLAAPRDASGVSYVAHDGAVYVRTDINSMTDAEVTAEDAVDDALLIVPNDVAQLAVRVAGIARALPIADVPPAVAGRFTGTRNVVRLTVRRVSVQTGGWSAAVDPAERSGNIRVAGSVLRIHGARSVGRPEVSFVRGPTVLARDGESLLELAEANGVPMEPGCRMGICGADPVQITAGSDNLSAIRRSEQATLDRLGLPPGCRMACSARVHGPVTVGTVEQGEVGPERASTGPTTTADFAVDPEVQRVVVIGTGIAGITAVEELRKLDSGIEITIVGSERHDFYNRMAISRLVDENTSPASLSLISPDWARRRRVRYLPGLAAVSIDRARREVIPAEGIPLPYDRLVLATGARSRIPAIDSIELDGVFALRTIDDALRIRERVHYAGTHRAVIVGGGLLGLEAAYHLVQTGLRVWIVGRDEWPANRQLDEYAGGLLLEILRDLGIEYVARSEPRRMVGQEAIEGVELLDGRVLPASLCLIAAGIVPEAGLARDSGLEVVAGVVVDDRMATSDPAIYAAGDAIEYQGRTYGLWPASVDQAIVAAANLLGGHRRYRATMAPAQLKVPGVDLLSVGEIAPRGPEEREIRAIERHARRYHKLIVRGREAIGAIILGSPALFDGVSDAVQTGLDLGDHLAAIEGGDWGVFSGESDARGISLEPVVGAI